jgi:hypothetical protein
MKKHNISNVRAIRNYCDFLKEAKRLSYVYIDSVIKAINLFEFYTTLRQLKHSFSG